MNIEGYVCRPPYRTEVYGIKVTSIMVACADGYVPAVAVGSTGDDMYSLKEGDAVMLQGRLRNREHDTGIVTELMVKNIIK